MSEPSVSPFLLLMRQRASEYNARKEAEHSVENLAKKYSERLNRNVIETYADSGSTEMNFIFDILNFSVDKCFSMVKFDKVMETLIRNDPDLLGLKYTVTKYDDFNVYVEFFW